MYGEYEVSELKKEQERKNFMKLLLVLLVFLLNGCYLANGSPNSTEFQVKDGKRISYEDRQFCFEKNKSKLKKKDKEQFEYLKNRYERLGYSNDGFSIMRTELQGYSQEQIEEQLKEQQIYTQSIKMMGAVIAY